MQDIIHQAAVYKNNPEKKPWGTRLRNELSKNKYLYVMSIPVILYYLIFHYLPMSGIVIAFKNYDVAKGLWVSPWVGFKNFTDFFSSIYFLRLLRNTFLISFYGIMFTFPAPIILALLFNELKSLCFKKIVQTVTYLPHFISMVVICGMIADFFSAKGFMTQIIAFFGGASLNYLGKAEFFRSIYVGSDIWQGVGWGSIIYLAAISSIDQELYEAAVIDGAGRFKQLLHITLPGLIPTITILLIMRIGLVLNVGYEKIILLYNNGTMETADVISSFVYRRGLGGSFQYSFSTAVGLFQSLINIILLVSANRFSKKVGETSLF